MELKYSIRPYRKGEEDYVAEAHERIYCKEYGWGEGFSRFAKQVVYEYANAPKQEHSEMWIAEVNGQPVGSIMLQESETKGVGQLRLYLLEKEYRNQGIGSALLNLVMAKAKEWNFQHLFLVTAEPCVDARRKYSQMGFVMTGRDLMTDWAIDGNGVYEERWELVL